MIAIQWFGIRLRQWICRHENRVRGGVFRPYGSARRHERYSCPACHRVWTQQAPLDARTRPPYTTPS